MDLGSSTLRRNGLNALYCAVHPKHGVAWTDGKAIYLAPLALQQEEVINANSTKLGQFEFVQSVHWSQNLSDPLCYLCVVHQTHITIWKAEGPPTNLDFKQVRKINATPIPQGCLWNPHRDILCVLNKDQCSFYFRHTRNKGSFSLPPIESGKLNCGCWSSDGTTLIVGIGSIILIYQWRDIDKSISDYAIIAWKVPNIDGFIRCLAPMENGRLVCTAEIALDKLCTASSHDMFDLKGFGDKPEACLSDGSDIEGDYELVKPGRGGSRTHTETLFNLPREDESGGGDSCQLIVFHLHPGMVEPQKLACENIKGILTPDLLHVQDSTVIVGSSNSSVLYAFHWTNAAFTVQPMALQKDERPKGLSSVLPQKNSGVLAMVGKQPPGDTAAFPCSSPYSTYDVSLRFLPTGQVSSPVASPSPQDLFKELQLSDRTNKVHLLRVSPLKMAQSEQAASPQTSTHERDDSSNESSPPFDLIIPTSSLHSPASQASRKIEAISTSPTELVQDLETFTADFANEPPQFLSPLNEDFSQVRPIVLSDPDLIYSKPERKPPKIPQRPLLRKDSTSSSNSGKSDASKKEGGENQSDVKQLEELIKDQGKKIEQLQAKVTHLAQLLESHPPAVSLPSPTNPPRVTLMYICPHTGRHLSKHFLLLHQGQLHVDTVKQAFGLVLLEIIVDGEACVVGGDKDGLMPLQFTPDSTVHITGRRFDESDI